MRNFSVFPVLGLLIAFSASAAPEGMKLQASTAEKRAITFESGRKVEDYALSANGGQILALVSGGKTSELRLIDLDGKAEKLVARVGAKADSAAVAVVAHPEKAGIWFVLTRAADGNGSILRYEAKGTALGKPTVLYKSENPLRRLVVGSRPFSSGSSEAPNYYRLFFAEKRLGHWWIRSMTEAGKALYELTLAKTPRSPWVCPDGKIPTDAWANENCSAIPSMVVAEKGALPLSFHPNGRDFLYEDEAGCVLSAKFDDQWQPVVPTTCQKASFYAPNGSLRWNWKKDEPGIKVYDGTPGAPAAPRALFVERTFTMPPIFAPDGRSIVGLEKSGDNETLSVFPNADFRSGVVNLWRFEKLNDGALRGLEKYGGIFLDGSADFFHTIYDRHSYERNQPMIVMTDPFWYVIGLAMEAGFVLNERAVTIPAYRRFLDLGLLELRAKKNATVSERAWIRILVTAESLLKGHLEDGADPDDYASCEAATGNRLSPTLHHVFDFTSCKPMSHYEEDSQFANYWRSFRYLTAGTAWSANSGAPFEGTDLAAFPNFSPSVMKHILAWFDGYVAWMAPPTFIALRTSDSERRWKSVHPYRKCGLGQGKSDAAYSLFPLGWGWDDETSCAIMNVRERNANLDEWVASFSGGSDFDDRLGDPEARKGLAAIQAATKTYFGGSAEDKTLYGIYLNALNTDLGDHEAVGTFARLSRDFRLARSEVSTVGGWTHLKHTLQLVSEEPNGAEGGEGGPSAFEYLIDDVPPHAVEPRPEVFLAQKKVVDQILKLVPGPKLRMASASDFEEKVREISSLLAGFAKGAQAQREGRPIPVELQTPVKEFGGFLDHADLYFHTIMNEKYAIARSMGKTSMAIIASVGSYRKDEVRHEYVATGNPLDTYFIVDGEGKRRIVAGASFSVYGFENPARISDIDWRTAVLPATKRPNWLEPLVLKEK